MTEHVRVPEPEDAVAFRIQPVLPSDIVQNVSISGMLTAVQLDDEPMLMAHEIDYERTNRCLAAKTETVEAMGAQLGP